MDQEWWTDDDPSKILAISTEIVMWDGRRGRCLQTGDFRSTAEVYETIRAYFKDGKPEKPRWVKDAYVRKQSTLSRE